MPGDDEVRKPGKPGRTNLNKSGTYTSVSKTKNASLIDTPPALDDDTTRTKTTVAVVRGVVESLRAGINELMAGQRDAYVRNLIQRAIWRAEDEIRDCGLGEHIHLHAEIGDTEVILEVTPTSELGRRIIARAHL